MQRIGIEAFDPSLHFTSNRFLGLKLEHMPALTSQTLPPFVLNELVKLKLHDGERLNFSPSTVTATSIVLRRRQPFSLGSMLIPAAGAKEQAVAKRNQRRRETSLTNFTMLPL